MKIIATIICCAIVFGSNISTAQKNIGPIELDPAFASGGLVVSDFGNSDEVSACWATNKSQVLPTQIYVGVRSQTSSPGETRFIITRSDGTGQPDAGFGINGKAYYSFPGAVTYVNAITTRQDSTVFAAAGFSGSSTDPSSGKPAAFFFKSNGAPDSSFGTNGMAAYAYDDGSAGEFNSVTLIEVGFMVACGPAVASATGGSSGFGAMWFKRNGTLDSSYGVNGKMKMDIALSSATGYFTSDLHIVFVGVAIKNTFPEIVLGKLGIDGKPDSSFGTNGIFYTGISLLGGSEITSTYFNLGNAGMMVIAAPIEPTAAGIPFTLLRFNLEDGSIDREFGIDGFTVVPAASNIHPLNMTTTNDLSIMLTGTASIGQGEIALVKYIITGELDTTFADHGIYIKDLSNGTKPNSLFKLYSIGQKKFVGAGTIGSGSASDVFLVGLHPAVPNTIKPREASEPLIIVPNPASAYTTITSTSPLRSIVISDLTGRTVQMVEQPFLSKAMQQYLIDVSGLPNGVYYCTITTTAGRVVKQVVVCK